MTTDLFISICDKMLKVSKIDKGLSYPFKSIEERQTARRFFVDKGIEAAYDKDENKKIEAKEDLSGFRIIIRVGNPLYVLHAYDENGHVNAMYRDDAEEVKEDLIGKGIDCYVEALTCGRNASVVSVTKNSVNVKKEIRPEPPKNSPANNDKNENLVEVQLSLFDAM